MPSLNDLPDELKLQIIALLDVGPPSQSQLYTSSSVAGIYQSPIAPLKNLSRADRSWSELLRAELFRHVVIQLADLLPACHSDTPESPGHRIDNLALEDRLWSIVQLPAPTGERSVVVDVPRDPSFRIIGTMKDNHAVQQFWTLVLNHLNPKRLVILASMLGPNLMLGTRSSTRHHHHPHPGAHDTCQLLELMPGPLPASSATDPFATHGIATHNFATDGRLEHTSVLHMRPWRRIHFREPPRGDDVTGVEAVTTQTLVPRCCAQQPYTSHGHRWQHLRDGMTALDALTLVTAARHRPPPAAPDLAAARNGVFRFQFVRELTLGYLPSRGEGGYTEAMDSVNSAADWEGAVEEVMGVLAPLRVEVVARCNDPFWRLRRVVLLDHEELVQYPVYVRGFEADVRLGLQGVVVDEVESVACAKWGRVWEVVDGEGGGARRVRPHD